ncbi:ExbD/TolR family protein [Thiomicrospira cyclica]|uniref:Tol-Pal system protein TolR n=1 Tax=Thiomicrospira cyclica (strain DSM 14477 / JCM 11371 / ALM1) TaxID=717773 RepID=F6D8D5_THICA|nr:ExbD/TolR family protein [Thiomicrospira cyclica]AEG31786.1 Biopolymer transport protein ExbD/TolR [Thiomicrospira cyclica ALM1]
MNTSLRSIRDKKRLMAEINVVPYIDVTLVLLIIFMITAPLVHQAITVDLPGTPEIERSVEATQLTPPFVITVTRDGLYHTSENPNEHLTPAELAMLVAEVVARSQLNEQLPIVIEGDRDAPYGRVVHLFVLLKNNGVPNVSLMTQPEDGV